MRTIKEVLHEKEKQRKTISKIFNGRVSKESATPR